MKNNFYIKNIGRIAIWFGIIGGLVNYFAFGSFVKGAIYGVSVIGIFIVILLIRVLAKIVLLGKSKKEHKCKHIKRVGESCRMNNNCTYPNCEQG